MGLLFNSGLGKWAKFPTGHPPNSGCRLASARLVFLVITGKIAGRTPRTIIGTGRIFNDRSVCLDRLEEPHPFRPNHILHMRPQTR